MIKLNIYERTFYHLYWFIFVLNKRTDKWRAALSSVIILSLLLFIISLFLFGHIIKFESKTIIYGIFISIFILNYWLFVSKKKYEKLEKIYSNDSKKHKLISLLFLIILLIAAISLSY